MQKKEPYPSCPRDGAQSTYRPVVDYLLIGEGHPLGITLPLYKLSVKNTLAQGTRRKAQGKTGSFLSVVSGPLREKNKGEGMGPCRWRLEERFALIRPRRYVVICCKR